jgi:hypothetical protein
VCEWQHESQTNQPTGFQPSNNHQARRRQKKTEATTMSSRAIRALRGDDRLLEVYSSEEEGEDDVAQPREKASAFAAILEGESSSEEEEESSSSNDDKVPATVEEKQYAPAKVEEEEEDDIDAIIDEFQEKDDLYDETDGAQSLSSNYFSILMEGMDSRDLDIDYSIRNSLLGNATATPPVSRSRRKTLLFGPPRDGWVRPPHYIGGGVGMRSYDEEPQKRLPWPYVEDEDLQTNAGDVKRWFSFIYSDSYKQSCEDYVQIQKSGDINALIMFVAHHPFETNALLQLSTVLYETNHTNEGLALLRRCLYTYESSASLSFSRDLERQSSFLDKQLPENEVFFKALAKLVQVSNIAGVPRTALALSRFVLSLDPLRDPMGLLLAIDHYALAGNATVLDQWIVDLVESDKIQIWYRDDETTETATAYQCGLLEMPNWMYSYALALYRLYEETQSEELKEKADNAIKKALSRFPGVVGKLLQENDVDTTGKSFRRDWLAVLDFATVKSASLQNKWATSMSAVDTIVMAATLQSVDLIVKIFVMQNARQWAEDAVLQWVHDSLKDLMEAPDESPAPPSPALMRYLGSNPADYDRKIQQLPPDANIIDPNLMAQAMIVDPRRRRLLRREHRAGGEHAQDENPFFPVPQQAFGGPPTNNIDPDWPLLEVFWRSFFPWNRVVGVPPPRR